MAEDNRRESERIESIVLVQLDADRHGIARNASSRGLLIATRSKLTAGDRIQITVRGRRESVETRARVVRVEETPPTEAWRYRVALELEDALPAELIEEGTAAAALFLRPGSIPPPSR